jgi:hypothetical protein
MSPIKILADKVGTEAFRTNHLYNDVYRKELAGLLTQATKHYSTKFDEVNWSEKTAFALGYNKAVNDLISFLLDKIEDIT